MKKHYLIIVCGLVGTGKTTVANYIASKISALVLSSDAERVQLVHKKKYVNFDAKRKKAFERREKDTVYNAIFISAGHLLEYTDVIIDATFDLNRYIEKARQIARLKKVNFKVIECKLESVIAKERVAKRFKSKRGHSVANIHIYKVVKRRYQQIPFRHAVVDTKDDWKRAVDRWIKVNIKK